MEYLANVKRKRETVFKPFLRFIGRNHDIYEKLQSTIIALYAETHDVGYCCILSELILGLIDAGLPKVCNYLSSSISFRYVMCLGRRWQLINWVSDEDRLPSDLFGEHYRPKTPRHTINCPYFDWYRFSFFPFYISLLLLLYDAFLFF
jgi:hypothetical protein